MAIWRIIECNDLETLRKLCMIQGSQLAYIGEVLVDESKMHFTSNEAIQMIREYLVEHQHDMEDILQDEQ
jgi:hypothetical protein